MTESEDGDDSIDSLLREAARIPKLDEEPDRVGRTLGRYRIEEELGRGGMGIVYAASDLELGRRVALKVLPSARVADEERRRRFLREARTAAKLSHEHLASIFDVGEADGTVFLAMELIAGGSLRTRIDAAPQGMPPSAALRIALELARGLGKAHAAGVVHRDLKPENVMMDGDGKAKIVDFGLAKLAVSGPSGSEPDLSTQDGKILGTPSYMAPEQAKGSRALPTADVFSLGVILYEMLTGSRPFAGTSLVDVIVSVARDAPPRPSRKTPGVPTDVDALVMRCLEKDPSLRYENGDAVAEAIVACAKGRRPRGLVWLALAVAMLAIGGSAVAMPATPAEKREETTPSITAMAAATASAAMPANGPSPEIPASASAAPSVVASVPMQVVPPSRSIAPRASTSGPPPPPSIDPLARQK